MLVFVAVEQAGMRGNKFFRFENIIKAESLEAARHKAENEFGTFKPSNVKEVRPATLEDIEGMLFEDADEVLNSEKELRDATPEEIEEMENWEAPPAGERKSYFDPPEDDKVSVPFTNSTK